MKTTIGIPEKNIEEVVNFLNTLIADEFVLCTKTRNAHWNVTGQNFYELHNFFASQYKALDIIIDETAERVRSLGHFAIGSLKDFMSITHMNEEKDGFSNSRQIIQTLLIDHETIIRTIRNDIVPIAEKYRDLGTAGFVTEIMEQHEKMAWMLRASLS